MGTSHFRAFALGILLLAPHSLVAAEQEYYTLFIELREPHDTSRAGLQKLLNAEGYKAYPEGDNEVSLSLTASELKKLFNARVIKRKVEKSSTSGMAPQPVLEATRIPARYEKFIRRIYFDPQRG